MKKTVCIIIAVFVLLSVMTVSVLAAGTVYPFGDAVILGDINGDGSVTADDTSALQEKLLNRTAGDTEDINVDEGADVADLVCLYLLLEHYEENTYNGITVGSGNITAQQ